MDSLMSFATKLLKTEDLDPVYSAIHRVQPSWELRSRLLLAYWCFYHLGAAAYIAEQGNTPTKFWALMQLAAANTIAPRIRPAERWPRASERRHFRGSQATSAVLHLHSRANSLPRSKGGSPESLFNWIVGAGTRKQTFQDVSDRVSQLRGFGPWITFKVADMTERVVGIPVNFESCAFGVYKDPRQGAALALHGDFSHPITDQEVADTMGDWAWQLRKFKAPPAHDRKVGVQEVETVFCKYKSHSKGHYQVGKDIIENVHSTDGWGDLAKQFQGEFLHMRDKAIHLGMLDYEDKNSH